MNIFYLHRDPRVAARYHNDKHVVKMILESAQMLSTAHRELDGNLNETMYRPTHKNHPSTVWVRESSSNYRWLHSLFISLCDEYTHRYGKVHLTDKKLRDVLQPHPLTINTTKRFTPPPQCMPEQYKNNNNTVQAYRDYYVGEKHNIASWKNRDVPHWWK